MERMIAYRPSCSSCFQDKLIKENFRVDRDKQIRVIMPVEEDIILGMIYDSNVIIYPELNVMSRYTISERTRLVRMCDEFKS